MTERQGPRRWTLRQGYSGVGVIGGPSLAAELSVIVVESSTYDALLAERDEWRGKAERQYDENVELIARNGALEVERDVLRAALATLKIEAARLNDAAVWALGMGDDFPTRQDGQGAYWWRTEFRKRCGDFLTTSATDEKHCACVPFLRAELAALKAKASEGR